VAFGTPLKVFVDLAPLAPDGSNGGAGVLVLRLLRALIARPGAHEYHLLVKPVSEGVVSDLIGAGAILHRVGPGLDIEEPRRLRREIRRLPVFLARALPDTASLTKEGADVLFSPLGTAAFHEPRLRHVAVAHDFQELSYPDFFDEKERRRRAAFRRDLGRADRVVAISEATKRDGVEKARLDAGRITVLPPVAGLPRQPLRTAEQVLILSRLELSLDGFIVYPANYWPHKNHDRLLSALVRAQLAAPGLRLALCGALDDGRERLLAAVRHRGLAETVRVFPYLSEDEVTALLQGARFLVFPSLFEGFGIPVLEAMALGTPVACSDIPALRELAGEDALYFNPEDEASLAEAMELLWGGDRKREELVAGSRTRAERLLATDTVGIYHRLLSF